MPVILGLGVPLTPGSVDLRVGVNKYQSSSCTASWWSEDDHLYILETGEHVWTFSRFSGVNIPKGATITSAHIEVTPRWFSGSPSGSDAIRVGVEQADDAAATTGYADIKSRFAALPATVEWSASAWVANSAASSPSLVSQVQDLVDRSGWVSGNSLVALTRTKDGYASVGAQAYSGPSSSGTPSRIPRLVVEFLS